MYTGSDDGLEAALSEQVVVGVIRLEDDHHLIGLALHLGCRSIEATESTTTNAALLFTPRRQLCLFVPQPAVYM